MATPIPEPDEYDKAIARTIAGIVRKQPSAPLAAADVPLIAAWYFRNGANLTMWPTEQDLVDGLNRMLADQLGRPIESIRWTAELNEDDAKPGGRLPLPDLEKVPAQIIEGVKEVALVVAVLGTIAALGFMGIRRII